MAINGCTNGVELAALAALLLLSAQYYVPERLRSKEHRPEPRSTLRSNPVHAAETWFFLDFPPLDLLLTVCIILLATITYLCDWIQRKLIEKRLLKLNQHLCDSVERLCSWDARQEQLEATLRMVQNATSEYNLFLVLLLRHRIGPPHGKLSSPYFLHQELEDLNITPPRSPAARVNAVL